MTLRTNLCTNPNFEAGVAGWTLQSSTIAPSSAQAHSGTQSMLVTLNAAVSAGAFTSFTQVVGTVYTLSAWVYSPVSLTLRVAYTGANVTTSSAVTIPAATWTRIFATGTATQTGGFLSVLTTVAPGAGSQLYVDDVLIEASSALGTNFDGSTPTTSSTWFAWTGAANASTSISNSFISVVANTSFTPPRMELTCTVPAGGVMKNATLSRIVNGVATQTLSQPSAGLDTQLVYDYLAPYGTPVSYEFISDYVPLPTTVWDETWPNLTNWSSTTGYSVSGGKVTGSGGPMSRTVTSGSYRVTIASLVGGVGGGVSFGSQLRVYANSAGYLVAVPIGLGGVVVPVTTSVLATSTVTIDFFGTSIVISGTGGTYTINGYSTTDFNQVQINSSSTIIVGELKVASYSTTSHVDSTAVPATLASAQAWLIHPASPALSVPISSSDLSSIAIQDLGAVSQASSTTLHTILGQSLPIATTSGPRYGNTQQVKLKARTAAHEAALNGILADGTPLLFRFPPTYDAGFDEGFYAVGTVQRERIAQRKGSHLRQFTLDLTQVQQPTVIVQNAGWSWAALAAAFPTWQAVAQAYNTWADVLTNNRKPGY